MAWNISRAQDSQGRQVSEGQGQEKGLRNGDRDEKRLPLPSSKPWNFLPVCPVPRTSTELGADLTAEVFLTMVSYQVSLRLISFQVAGHQGRVIILGSDPVTFQLKYL